MALQLAPYKHHFSNHRLHYIDVIMTTMASQITSLTVVYSIVYSGVDQRKHQSSASLAFVRGIHRGRWIPRTKGQLCGKCFHLMTSSCIQTDDKKRQRVPGAKRVSMAWRRYAFTVVRSSGQEAGNYCISVHIGHNMFAPHGIIVHDDEWPCIAINPHSEKQGPNDHLSQHLLSNILRTC